MSIVRRPLVVSALFSGVLIGAVSTSVADDGPPDLQQLKGTRVDVKLTTGKSHGSVEVVSVSNGTAPGSIRAMTIRPSDSPRLTIIAAATVDEIVAAGTPLDVTYDKRTRELSHDPEKRKARLAHAAMVEERLTAKRARFWEDISEEDQAKYVAEQKEFLTKASEKIGKPMQLLETKYYLFYTDMPINTVGIYVKYLDQMYENMVKAFDFPEGKNIWRGKCPVVAFQNRQDYYRFESEVMNNPNAEGSQGLCHSYGDGRVVMACFKGTSEGFFAVVLVHETSHGFVHRYRTSARVPPWINEGIADWVAGTVVGKLDDDVRDRQQEAVAEIRRSGTLGGQFYADNASLSRTQYGTASSLVEILLRVDPKKYRKLIDNVKEGMESEEALRDAYGFGFAELTQQYGRLAGVPNLQP
jgi:hypothetical protein